MGFIETMAIGTAAVSGVISFGPPVALWLVLMGTLGTAGLGVYLAGRPRRQPVGPLDVARLAPVH